MKRSARATATATAPTAGLLPMIAAGRSKRGDHCDDLNSSRNSSSNLDDAKVDSALRTRLWTSLFSLAVFCLLALSLHHYRDSFDSSEVVRLCKRSIPDYTENTVASSMSRLLTKPLLGDIWSLDSQQRISSRKGNSTLTPLLDHHSQNPFESTSSPSFNKTCSQDSDCLAYDHGKGAAEIRLGEYICLQGMCRFTVTAGELCNVGSDCAAYQFTVKNSNGNSDGIDVTSYCAPQYCTKESTCDGAWTISGSPPESESPPGSRPDNMPKSRSGNGQELKCCRGLDESNVCRMMSQAVSPCGVNQMCDIDPAIKPSLKTVNDRPQITGGNTDDGPAGKCVNKNTRKHIWIGILLCLVGGSVLNIGLNMQKKAYLNMDKLAAEKKKLKKQQAKATIEHRRMSMMSDNRTSYIDQQSASRGPSVSVAAYPPTNGNKAQAQQQKQQQQQPKPKRSKLRRVLSSLAFWRSLPLGNMVWLTGFVVFILGNVANFTALQFAPQSLVAPLGAISLVTNVIVAPWLNGERLSRWDIGGIVLIIGGCVIAVVFSGVVSIDYRLCVLINLLKATATVVYLCIIGSCVIAMFTFIQIVERAIKRREHLAKVARRAARDVAIAQGADPVEIAAEGLDSSDDDGNNSDDEDSVNNNADAIAVREDVGSATLQAAIVIQPPMAAGTRSHLDGLFISNANTNSTALETGGESPATVNLRRRRSNDIDAQQQQQQQQQHNQNMQFQMTPLPSTDPLGASNHLAVPHGHHPNAPLSPVTEISESPSRDSSHKSVTTATAGAATTASGAAYDHSFDGSSPRPHPQSFSPLAAAIAQLDSAEYGSTNTTSTTAGLPTTVDATLVNPQSDHHPQRPPLFAAHGYFIDPAVDGEKSRRFSQISSAAHSDIGTQASLDGREPMTPLPMPRSAAAAAAAILAASSSAAINRDAHSTGATAGATAGDGGPPGGIDTDAVANDTNLPSWLIRFALPLAYASLGGLMATLTTLFAKSLINLLAVSITQGKNQFTSFLAWVILIVTVTTAVSQVFWINMGLRRYDALLQVPVFYVVWTVFDIIGGGIYYDEFAGFTATKAVVFSLGVLIIFVGVGILARRLKSVEETNAKVDQAAKNVTEAAKESR